jgi:hypothetical protein
VRGATARKTVDMKLLDHLEGKDLSLIASVVNTTGMPHVCGAIIGACDRAYAQKFVHNSGHGQQDMSLLSATTGLFERANFSIGPGPGITGPKFFDNDGAFEHHVRRYTNARRTIILKTHFLAFRAQMYFPGSKYKPVPIDEIMGGSRNDFLEAAKTAAGARYEYHMECGPDNVTLAELEGIALGCTLDELAVSAPRPTVHLNTPYLPPSGTAPYTYIQVHDKEDTTVNQAPPPGAGRMPVRMDEYGAEPHKYELNGQIPGNVGAPHGPGMDKQQVTPRDGGGGGAEDPDASRLRAKLDQLAALEAKHSAAQEEKEREGAAIKEGIARRDAAAAAQVEAEAQLAALFKMKDRKADEKRDKAKARKAEALEREAAIDAKIKRMLEHIGSNAADGSDEGGSSDGEEMSQAWQLPPLSEDEAEDGQGKAKQEREAGGAKPPAVATGIKIVIKNAVFKCVNTGSGTRKPNIAKVKEALANAGIVSRKYVHGCHNARTTRPRLATITLTITRSSYGQWDEVINNNTAKQRMIAALEPVLNLDSNEVPVTIENDNTLGPDWAGLSVDEKMRRDQEWVQKTSAGKDKKRQKK